jgi:hypothetical protein
MKIEPIGPDNIKKPVSTLAMVPKSGAITRIGRQAYTVMMISARDQGAEDDITKMFSAPLNSIIRGFEGSSGTVKELKKHLYSMVSHIVEWQSPSPGEVEEWGASGLLSEVKLRKQGGENWLHWAYPPSLRQEMLSPQRFAQIRRSTIAQFRSHAGLALYEICARYKHNPSHLTSKQHWHWWLPVLTGKPVSKEIKTEFRFFNRDTIKPAIEEVNEVSELIVSIHEYKVGRTIEFLQFEVHLKPESTVKDSAPVDLSKLARAHELGIDPEIAEDLYIRYGELTFSKAIRRLEQRLALSGTPVLSRHAYLKSLLAEKIPENPIVDLVTKAIGQGEQKHPKIAPHAGDVRQAKFQEREAERVQIVRSEIDALDENARYALLTELKESLIERGVAKAIIQRINDGKWQSALIMGELMRFYWKRTRGSDWLERN